MTNKFLKPLKRFMSLSMACRKLEVDEEEFQRLSIALEILPVLSKAKHRLDHVEGNSLFYRIEEIENIRKTHFFRCMKRIKVLEEKRRTYKDLPRYKKDICIDYEKVVSEQYRSFEEAFKGLPFSIKLVYARRRLAEFEAEKASCKDSSILCDTEKVFSDFYALIVSNSLLRKCFIGREGFYFSMGFIDYSVEWFVPFKFEKKIENGIVAFLYPKCIKHIKMVTEHMESYLSEEGVNAFYAKKLIFGGDRFLVLTERYFEIYKLVIESCGGIVSCENYKYAVVDREIEDVLEEVIYVQPQFVFEALNSEKIPDWKEYRIGKQPPVQCSAFKEKKKLLISQDELLTLSRREKEAYFRKEYI